MDQETAAKAEVRPTLSHRQRVAEAQLHDHDYQLGVMRNLLADVCKELDLPIPEFVEGPRPGRSDHNPGRF